MLDAGASECLAMDLSSRGAPSVECATRDLMQDTRAADPSRDGHTTARFGMTRQPATAGSRAE